MSASANELAIVHWLAEAMLDGPMLLIKHGRFKSIMLINSFHGLIFLRGYFRFNLQVHQR
jgi:hypothetical protein